MLRSLTTNPIAVAALCGVLSLLSFLLHANVTFGESILDYILTGQERTIVNVWFSAYMLLGICLLGSVTVLLYARYGVVSPAVVLVVLSAGYLYIAEFQVTYLFAFYTPQFLSVLLGIGTTEYIIRAVFVETVSIPNGLELALGLGALHAALAVGVSGVTSPGPLLLSLGTVFVVAVPTLLFLQFGAVGPALGAVTGLVFVSATHWQFFPKEYPGVIPQALVTIFLFGGIEYLLRSTNVVGG